MTTSNHFLQEKKYSDRYYQGTVKTCLWANYTEDSYTITFKPDGSFLLKREYFRFEEDPDWGKNDIIKSTYKGVYEIVSENQERRVFKLTFNKETTVSRSENINNTYVKVNQDINIQCEVIERIPQNRLGFSTILNNNFSDQSDEEYFKNEVEFLIQFNFTQSEIIQHMVTFKKDMTAFFNHKFPQLNVNEIVKFFLETASIYKFDYKNEDLYKSIVNSNGDKYLVLAELFPKYKEFRTLMLSTGITDSKVIDVEFRSCPRTYYNAEEIFKYYNRHEIYKNQIQRMKEYYGCMDDKINLETLVCYDGNIRLSVHQINEKVYLKKTNEELFSKGYTNEELNLRVLNNVGAVEVEDLLLDLKIEYDQKLREDFGKIRLICNRFDYNLNDIYDVYNKNNGNWVLTVFELKNSKLFEMFKDKVPHETLPYALLMNYYNNEDKKLEILKEKLQYFQSKDLQITEGEMLKFLAYISLGESHEEDYNSYKNMDTYLQLKEDIKKRYPQLNNDYLIMKNLYEYKGNITNVLYNLKISPSILFEKEFNYIRQLSDLNNLSDSDIGWKIYYHIYSSEKSLSLEKLADYLRFYTKEEYKTFIKDLEVDNNIDLKGLFNEITSNKRIDNNLVKLFIKYPHVYESFKNEDIDSHTLWGLTENLNGDAEEIRRVLFE